ncbi:hypothetical protein [Kitasatospora griseola]|uniref:hypothetical protein n=1 Tax=Kitasatospora griseola TaxID=2064 RepID=UPI0037FE0BDC
MDVTVTTVGGTSTTSGADTYAYVNTAVRVQGAGRIPVGSHAGTFGVTVQRTTAGAISGHLEFQDQAGGVHLGKATFTDVYTTVSGTAYATGTASCTIGGVTSSWPFTLTATDGGKNVGSFTLTYNATTVSGTILSGHVTVTTGGFSSARLAADPAATSPVAAATASNFTASLLGISLTGGQCGTGAAISSTGTATAAGEVSCLLLGVAGINIDVDLPVATGTTGTTGTNAATLSGTVTVTVGGALPLSLPATAYLASAGSAAGLQLTVACVALPVLPVGTGGIDIG